jgi:hypothetical protein
MKLLRGVALSIFVAIGFSGCIQDEKVVKLKPDGSGTFEETFVIGVQALAQIKQLSEGFGALGKSFGKAGGASSAFKVLDEGKLRDAAEKLGDGVKFVSAKAVTSEAGEGYSVIYSFSDINKLRLDQNPADNLPAAASALQMHKGKKESIKFDFKKGAPALLTVKMPTPKDSDLKDRPQIPSGQGDMAATMMQQMFKDMKVSVAIEVEGRISESNAEYQDASRVTLVEMDFNKVLSDPEKFKSLLAAQPKTIEEAKALVKGVDGMKAETQPTVSVKFE